MPSPRVCPPACRSISPFGRSGLSWDMAMDLLVLSHLMGNPGARPDLSLLRTKDPVLAPRDVPDGAPYGIGM